MIKKINGQKPHEIELSDLQGFIEKEEVTYASSTRENKKLVVTLNGTFKLYVGNIVVWCGIQCYSAVEKYNEITDKYINPLKDFKI